MEMESRLELKRSSLLTLQNSAGTEPVAVRKGSSEFTR